MNAQRIREPQSGVRGRLAYGESMALHTSWRVGGPADRWFEPADREDLSDFVRQLPDSEPMSWVGLGSNLLVRDGGIRGTVICLKDGFDEIRPELAVSGSRLVQAGAAAHCARLAKTCADAKLAGLGFLIGVPGTLGGALAMNAGAHGGETWDFVESVEVLFDDGHFEWLPKAAFETGYRHVVAPAGFAGFTAARLRLDADADGSGAADMKAWLTKRRATQPVGKPTAGSTFRNPQGDHAARLIESCGLKGHRIGGAVVSAMHANFIVTEAGARAADVERLIDFVRAEVERQRGVKLQPEVRFVGDAA
ncbi:UDP-N-acetylmuramate dehydrogenase [Algiphilus sp. W345]|uniref:UDP-N-acetylenolpyruvoylglucosamine reductase n=1 Tax=Banduia mediterranea TaxID=3075609 RepID=A0ABU2WMN4_9GAMM|nr:UDP-N-acetylmuramate dehydrogenase [Algiphilus sp. W345]MDT0498489.1 UDP-N-acetylmuramate dehydrogenase [Algiphilus sp. W345]